jgi:hypothetical protein
MVSECCLVHRALSADHTSPLTQCESPGRMSEQYVRQRETKTMPRLCAFQQRGHPIYVNPVLVRVVREVNDTTTAVEFANDHVLQIAIPLEKVHEKLNEAMNN